MKRIPPLYYLLLALLLLVGCNEPKHVTDALARSEALMDEQPDSAWAVLNTISPDEMGQNRTRALYALLYTQAQDKTYRDETNDSLISVAVDYYRDTDDVRRNFLAYYYKGRVHFNAKDYLNATSCYMEAEQLADAVGDDYLTGLLYAELGRIYRLYYDYPKSLEAHQKAAECYERAGKIRHRNYMWYNQVNVYRNMNKYNDGERLLRMILESSRKDGDKVLAESSLGSLVMLCIEQNRMPEAMELYEELRTLVDEGYGSPSFMGKLVRMYVSGQNLDEAKLCLRKGWKFSNSRSDSVALYFASAELLNALGKEKAAYQELLKGVALQNDEAHLALQQPVLTAQRDYLSEKLDFEAYRFRMERQQKLLSVLLLSVLLLVVVYVFIRLLKKIKKKSSLAISHLEKEKMQTEAENNRIASLLKQLDEDKKEADLTIEELKHEIVRKEEQNEDSRLKMMALVRKLETDNEANAVFVSELRVELKAMQEADRGRTLQNVELLKDDLEHSLEWIGLYEEKWPKADLKEKRIREQVDWLKRQYFDGEEAFRNVENLVNVYLDNAMLHFRREVSLAAEADYRRVCYMFTGLSAPFIARIMGESKEVVYQRRSRLLKKIASSSFLHKEMFILLLGK